MRLNLPPTRSIPSKRAGLWIGASLVGLLLVAPATADAGVARFRIQFDGTPSTLPRVGSVWTSATGAEMYAAATCSTTGCGLGSTDSYSNIPNTHWVGASPLSSDISLVDDQTPYRDGQWTLDLQFPPGPGTWSGTVTITDSDGTTRSVPWTRTDSQQTQLVFGVQNRPPPPPPPAQQIPTTQPCSVATLEDEPFFYPLLRGSVTEFEQRWRRRPQAPRGKGRLILNNIYACGTGRIKSRITLPRSRRKPVLVASGSLALAFKSPGRVAVKLELTRQGRELRKKQRRTRVKVTIHVSDGSGGSLTYTRRAVVGKKSPSFTRGGKALP